MRRGRLFKAGGGGVGGANSRIYGTTVAVTWNAFACIFPFFSSAACNYFEFSLRFTELSVSVTL